MVVAESADLSYNEREHQQTMCAQWDRRMELLTFVTKNMAVPPIFRDSYRTLPNSSGGLITLLSPSTRDCASRTVHPGPDWESDDPQT
jgi:hypothetical protein